jgi:hypothetical protein
MQENSSEAYPNPAYLLATLKIAYHPLACCIMQHQRSCKEMLASLKYSLVNLFVLGFNVDSKFKHSRILRNK